MSPLMPLVYRVVPSGLIAEPQSHPANPVSVFSTVPSATDHSMTE